ncbi:hypothetical protein C9I98_05080 [Photobacterium sanctipauli]|uniref:DUF805 domain-containing protein n=2 Tax=Photobacterium sanctipauli TaxID=1342794 RepID=A0A2T3NZ54_9GAMM|nr:hypothetical protein C9I98_05080 [Photobacterium sanctipauli]
MFKDKFGKWPRLMKLLVLLSLLPPVTALVLVHQNLAPLHLMHDVLVGVSCFNALLLTWGLLLKIRSKKYWYRNYHIGKTMMLAVVPILACGYILVTDPHEHNIANQTKQDRAVQITIN